MSYDETVDPWSDVVPIKAGKDDQNAFVFRAWGEKINSWFEAAEAGNVDKLKKIMIDQPTIDVDIRRVTKFPYETALMIACKNQHQEAVQYLLSVGASLNTARSFTGDNAFMASMASPSGATELTRWLLTQGADIYVRPMDGGTLIHHAAFWGNIECLTFLIIRGLDYTALNRYGMDAETLVRRSVSKFANWGEDFVARQWKAVKFLQSEAPKLVDELAKMQQKQAELAAGSKEKKGERHIMISYQWDDQERMLAIAKGLEARGYTVWMDIEHMTGSTLAAMANAVEEAEMIIVGLSPKYMKSPSCQMEAEYAVQLNKPIIPLQLYPAFKAQGWLGLMLGLKLWFDFTTTDVVSTSLGKLVGEIGRVRTLAKRKEQRLLEEQEERELGVKKGEGDVALIREISSHTNINSNVRNTTTNNNNNSSSEGSSWASRTEEVAEWSVEEVVQWAVGVGV